MNKIFVPKVKFENVVADEKRIEAAYARIFTMARRNILEKNQLTKLVAQKYTEVQYGRQVFNSRGSSQKITS